MSEDPPGGTVRDVSTDQGALSRDVALLFARHPGALVVCFFLTLGAGAGAYIDLRVQIASVTRDVAAMKEDLAQHRKFHETGVGAPGEERRAIRTLPFGSSTIAPLGSTPFSQPPAAPAPPTASAPTPQPASSFMATFKQARPVCANPQNGARLNCENVSSCYRDGAWKPEVAQKIAAKLGVESVTLCDP